jgi:hypothetical protein
MCDNEGEAGSGRSRNTFVEPLRLELLNFDRVP